jgi:hypothetical protein
MIESLIDETGTTGGFFLESTILTLDLLARQNLACAHWIHTAVLGHLIRVTFPVRLQDQYPTSLIMRLHRTDPAHSLTRTRDALPSPLSRLRPRTRDGTLGKTMPC